MPATLVDSPAMIFSHSLYSCHNVPDQAKKYHWKQKYQYDMELTDFLLPAAGPELTQMKPLQENSKAHSAVTFRLNVLPLY